jgi:serine protease AprX
VVIARRVCVFAAAAFLVVVGESIASAETYVESGLKGAGKQHVIITVSPGRESEIIDALKKHGSPVRSLHPSIGGVATDINGSDVGDLASHGAVAITRDHAVHISSKSKVFAKDDGPQPIDPNAPQPMSVSTLRLSLGLTAGSAGNLSSGVNGQGVNIAIIDSGIAPTAHIRNPVQFFDFTSLNADGSPTQPVAYDDLGHGTHIAGLIAGTGAAPGYMFQGIAPNANLVVLKVLDKDGASKTSTVIKAVEFVVKNHLAQVINLSLGHPITAPAKFDPLVQAVEDAARHNVIVVIAAGNDGPGYGSINSPGNSPSAITVGAADGKTTVTRADDYVASFSSKGPTWYDGFAKPDVAAPGVNLFSEAAPNSVLVNSTSTTAGKNGKPFSAPTYPQETVDGELLLDLSGTSVATAVATGVVALELDANAHLASGSLTPNSAKAILEYTAIKIANTDVLTQGAGQINAAGAVQLAGSINTTAPAGSWWLTSTVAGSSTIGGQTYSWAQNIIWGTSLIGGKVIYYKNLAWDDNIIWGTNVRGTSARSATRILGTDFHVIDRNVVFGKDDGDNIIWGSSLAKFRVVGERVGNKIVWDKDGSDNILWGTLDDDNILWGTDDGDNIIWGTWAKDGDNIIWGTTADDNILWGTSTADDNIIWGTSATAPSKLVKNNSGNLQIVWAAGDSDNILWGTSDDNILWGTSDDNILWGTDGDNILWGTDGDNILWGTDGDNIIWGTSVGGVN